MKTTYKNLTQEMKNAAEPRVMGFHKPTILEYIINYDKRLEAAVCDIQVSKIEKTSLHEMQKFLSIEANKDHGLTCLRDGLPALMHEAALSRAKELKKGQQYTVYAYQRKVPFSKSFIYICSLYAFNGLNFTESVKLFDLGYCKDKNELRKFMKDNRILKDLSTKPNLIIRPYNNTQSHSDSEMSIISRDLMRMSQHSKR